MATTTDKPKPIFYLTYPRDGGGTRTELYLSEQAVERRVSTINAQGRGPCTITRGLLHPNDLIATTPSGKLVVRPGAGTRLPTSAPAPTTPKPQ